MEAKNVSSDSGIELLRSTTQGCKQWIHLNNAGASLVDNSVRDSIISHITLESSIGGYEAAEYAKKEIGEFYQQAAQMLNCKPENIAYTSSATDAFSRALSAIPFLDGDTILTDTNGFVSNQIQFLSLKKKFGIKIAFIKNLVTGEIDVDDLAQQLNHLKPKLLAITHIPTNSGLVQPVKAIAEVFTEYCKRYRENTWYILDACQSVGQMKVDVKDLNCDFLSCTIRKFLRGPRGSGLLYISDQVLKENLEPLFIDMRGANWSDKNKYELNTTAARFEDWEFAYALVIGSAKAIGLFNSLEVAEITNRIHSLSNYLRNRLSNEFGFTIQDRGSELSSTTTFHVPWTQPEILYNNLKLMSINVSISYKNYALLDFIEKNVSWVLRVSPHYYNTTQEIDMFIDSLKKIENKLNTYA